MSRLSLRSAVNAKCKSCIHDPGNGNGGWREQVEACSSANCPLHPVRPMPVTARKTLTIIVPAGSGSPTAPSGQVEPPGQKVGLNDDVSSEGRAA